MFGYGKSLNRIEEKVDALIRQLKATDWRCRDVRIAVLGLEKKMTKVDEWNAKWDQMMDSVHALMALVKSLKEKIDPESKAAADEAMSDVAAGMAEVGEFVKANVVSGE